MDAHYDRVSHDSYELCIMHLHYALGVHIVCYVLRITYYVLCITHCHWESTSSVMYYVLRIMRIMHYALGVHIVCYVLRITYYVLCMTHWDVGVHIVCYVLFNPVGDKPGNICDKKTPSELRCCQCTYNPSQLMAARAAAPVRAHKGGWVGG